MKDFVPFQNLMVLVAAWFICIGDAFGSTISIGPDGINSAVLPYTGAGISIGQVEPERPGMPDFDDGTNSNFFVRPKEVFLLNGNPAPTENEISEIYDTNPPNDPPNPPFPHAT